MFAKELWDQRAGVGGVIHVVYLFILRGRIVYLSQSGPRVHCLRTCLSSVLCFVMLCAFLNKGSFVGCAG